jgi:hypothetical protein
MGTLSLFKAYQGARSAPPLFGTGNTGFGPTGPSGFAPKTPIESFDLNKAAGFGASDVTQGAANIFSTLGRLPGQIAATPPAVLDVASGGRIGKFVGGIPGVGAVVGAADTAIKKEGAIIPALINSQDAGIWRAIGNLPDNTEITNDLLAKNGFAPSTPLGGPQQTGGIPIIGNLLQIAGLGLGPLSHNKTVGELRKELTKRGFFYDQQGNSIDPAELAQQLRSGKRSTLDFGNQAINDDPLVNLLGSFTLDPLNLLFLVPGANVARAGMLAGKIGDTVRALRGVENVQKALKVVQVADAVDGTAKTLTTLDQVAKWIKGYQKVSISTAAGNTVLNVAAHAINTFGPPQGVLFSREVQEFTDAVNGRRDAMSQNAALSLFAAATFPYGAVVKGALKGSGRVTGRVLGGNWADGFVRQAVKTEPITINGKTLTGMAKFIHIFGGPDAAMAWGDFLDAHIAASSSHILPAMLAKIEAIPNLVARRKEGLQMLERVVSQMRRDGEITPEMRDAFARDWYSKQGGFEIPMGPGADPKIVGINPYDFATMGKRWADFYHGPRGKLKAWLDTTGELTYGLRDKVLKEQLDNVHQDLAGARVFQTIDGVRTEVVPIAKVRQVLNDNPHLQFEENRGKKPGYWSQFGEGADASHPPTWASLRAKLAAQKREAPTIDEYYAPIAALERQQPKDIQAELVGYRGMRDLRAEIDQLRQAMEADPTLRPSVETARRIEAARRLSEDPSAPAGERAAAQEAINRLEAPQNSDLRQRLNAVTAELKGQQAAQDAAIAGGAPGFDPAFRQQVFENAAAQAEVPLPFIDPSIKHADPVEQTLIGMMEREMAHADPSYVVKGLPKGLTVEIPPELTTPLRYRTALGEALFLQGPLSGPGRAFHMLVGGPARALQGLTKHVPNSDIRKALVNELQQTMLPMGFNVKEIRGLLKLMDDEAAKHVAHLGSLDIRLFREAGALWPSTVDKMVNDIVATMRGAPKAKAAKAVREAGGGYQMFAKSSSRFYRSVRQAAQAGIDAAQGVRDATARAELDAQRAVKARTAIEAVTTKRAKVARAAKADAADAVAADSAARLDAAKAQYARARNPKAERTLTRYNGWMDSRYTKGLSKGQHMLAKFVYPFFRFSIDPRWLLMNYAEGGILATSKFGVFRRYRDESQASQGAQHMLGQSQRADEAVRDPLLQPATRPMNLTAQASMDHAGINRLTDTIDSLEAQGRLAEAGKLRAAQGLKVSQEMQKAMDVHGETDANLRTLRQAAFDEGIDLHAKADAGLADGSLTAGQAADIHLRAAEWQKGDNRSLSQYFMDEAYRIDRKGAGAVITEEAKRLLGGEDYARMAPLIQQLHDVNVQTWKDVRELFYGNPNRSNLERLMNSYWFTWPISYQIKATKWLAETMLDGSFGNDNHALMAGKYAIWQQQYNEMIQNNPDFRAMMASNPVVGFAAQMLLPIAPDSIGVSLGRLTRVIGEFSEDQINQVFGPKGAGWTDGQLNLFTLDAMLQNPGQIPTYLTQMGIPYTVDLVKRLAADLSNAQTPKQRAFSPLRTSSGASTLGNGQLLPPRQP